MKNFLDDPHKYYGYDSSHYERFARNAMMWDFGFDNDVTDDKQIDQWIKYLENTFDLGPDYTKTNLPIFFLTF